MKKIKSFTHFDDSIINQFIDISKGKIVNYNPVVIEYDDKDLKEDPYKNYDVFKLPKDLIITGSYAFNDEDLSTARYMNYKADTICLPKTGNSSKVIFIFNGNTILDNTDVSRYITISFHTKNTPQYCDLYFCIGGYYFTDYNNIDTVENLHTKLKEMGCKQLNYDSIFN